MLICFSFSFKAWTRIEDWQNWFIFQKAGNGWINVLLHLNFITLKFWHQTFNQNFGQKICLKSKFFLYKLPRWSVFLNVKSLEYEKKKNYCIKNLFTKRFKCCFVIRLFRKYSVIHTSVCCWRQKTFFSTVLTRWSANFIIAHCAKNQIFDEDNNERLDFLQR